MPPKKEAKAGSKSSASSNVGKARAGSVAGLESSQPDKKPKQAELVQCDACRKKPHQLAEGQWAEYQTHTGKQQPMGKRCMPCYEMWQKAFVYLSWQSFSSLMQTEDGGDNKKIFGQGFQTMSSQNNKSRR